MAMSRRLDELLQARHVKYHSLRHPRALTAQGVALAAGIAGRNVAKVVALRDEDGDWLLAVVPAPRRVDLAALENLSGYEHLRLATEAELSRRFGDCELGAIIPLRQVHGIPVFMDDEFVDCREIYFEDGTHQGLVGMSLPTYLGLAQPLIGHFGTRATEH